MEEGRGGERRSAAACTTACKNDRALTRYKSHYDVNLLDPSPPTDFQPPGTVLGYGLWATSHANSDEVAPSLSLSLSISPFLHPPVPSSSFAPSCLLLSLQPPIRLFQSLSFRLSGFIRKPIPTPSHRGAPSLHGPEPGNICPRDICVLIESPISSLIERTIGRSLSLSLRFRPTGCPLITLSLSLLFHLIRAYQPIVLSGPEIGIPGIRLQSYERFSRFDTLQHCSILTFLCPPL